MIIDCPTPTSGDIRGNSPRSSPAKLTSCVNKRLIWTSHQRCMRPLWKKQTVPLCLGLRAPLTGFLTVNDTVAEYIRTDPKKLIGFAAICPTEDHALEEVDRRVQELGLRG